MTNYTNSQNAAKYAVNDNALFNDSTLKSKDIRAITSARIFHDVNKLLENSAKFQLDVSSTYAQKYYFYIAVERKEYTSVKSRYIAQIFVHDSDSDIIIAQRKANDFLSVDSTLFEDSYFTTDSKNVCSALVRDDSREKQITRTVAIIARILKACETLENALQSAKSVDSVTTATATENATATAHDSDSAQSATESAKKRTKRAKKA